MAKDQEYDPVSDRIWIVTALRRGQTVYLSYKSSMLVYHWTPELQEAEIQSTEAEAESLARSRRVRTEYVQEVEDIRVQRGRLLIVLD